MAARNMQRGAVAPLIAVLLLVIVVAVAFVVDLGHIHNVKAELQRAVDAAALAGARQLPNADNVDTVARAVAATNMVDNAPVPVDVDHLRVELGLWRTDRLDLPVSNGTSDCTTPTDRWNGQAGEDLCGSTPNAVLVRATRDVQHAFFFFANDTEVVADAIALAKPIYPTLPLAMVSCIPTNDASQPPGTLPNMTICGVVGHVFSSDPADLAAWSSLTFGPASAQNILSILEDEDDFTRFNQILFGRNLDDTEGIENDPVSTSRPGSFNFNLAYEGCINNGLDINCGLGKINGKEIAPPGDFVAPAGIPPLQTATYPATGKEYYTGSTSFDPLADYTILPRWYNINDNAGFDALDHFVRVVSQDGILLRGPNETVADFQVRMADLKDGDLQPYGATDRRFIYDNQRGDDNFIDNNNRPNYLAVARYAGYPRVNVMNGVTVPIMQAFMQRLFEVDDLKDIADDTALPCTNNIPFPTGQKSVRINVPVIFAGNCETWKAVNNSKFTYIGMADFLMTRSQLTNVMYACAEGERGYAGSCTETFSPPLDGTREFGPVTFNSPLMIEGVYELPLTDDDDKGGLVRVLLVE